jgi:hypothetical protein
VCFKALLGYSLSYAKLERSGCLLYSMQRFATCLFNLASKLRVDGIDIKKQFHNRFALRKTSHLGQF